MEKVNVFDAIDANKRNSVILMLVMAGLVLTGIMVLSYLFDAGEIGIIIGALFTICYIWIGYSSGSKIILNICGAKEVKDREEPFLQNIVEGLAIAARIPKPKIWIIEDEGMNAFATGISPENSHIVFTRGLLKNMTREEIEGVAAHEIAHIANYDIRFATLAVVLVGTLSLLGAIGWRYVWFGGSRDRKNGILIIIALLFVILAPIFAEFVRFAISREREYLADAHAAKLTRYPKGLASALERIKGHANVATATKTTASLFISDPFEKKFSGLFATHPPIEERVKRLNAM